MRPPSKWADWAVFEPAARRLITEFIATHPKHRAPKHRELNVDGTRWFITAAKRHGGLRAVLTRLGFKPARREDKPTRRSDWNQFANDIRPIIAAYLQANGRLPTQKQLREGGHVWIDRAIVIHHGGYETTYRKLGYTLPNNKPLSHWPTFSAKFTKAVEQREQELGRTPKYEEMLSAGHKLLIDAAFRSHGGYRAALVRIGRTPTRQGKESGGGLAGWENFATEFKPVLQQFVTEHNRPPSLTNLRQLGLVRYYYAARNHHGGYLAVLRRLGVEPTAEQTVKPRQGWRNQQRQRQTLDRHFPELTRLGIMPSSTMVKRRIPGLSAYWTWRRCRWAQIAMRLGLVPYAIGRPQLDRLKAISEALAYFRQHKTWPNRSAMSRQLQRQFARAGDWEKLCTPDSCIPALQSVLQEMLKNHWQWSERFHPASAATTLLWYNAVVLAGLAAAQRSSPSS